jgi:hypothetical protein
LIRRQNSVRVVYITPSHQYPLGVTMSASRRMQLLNWAALKGMWIIEDDYDSEYRFGSRPIVSLQGLDKHARVVYIGTFSKVLFPAIRLAYVVVPQDLVPAFSAYRDAADIFPSTLYQAVVTDFIRGGHFARHIRRMKMLYMERRNCLVQALNAELEEAASRPESQFAFYLDEPALVTLGVCYERVPRFGGGVYHPILRRLETFTDDPLRTAIKDHEKRATMVLDLEQKVAGAVTKLKERGLVSPYLRSFVVARINPLRWIQGEPPALEEVLKTMRERAAKFNVEKIKPQDLAGAGGPPDDEA